MLLKIYKTLFITLIVCVCTWKGTAQATKAKDEITFTQDNSIIYYEKDTFLPFAKELQELLFQSSGITISISKQLQTGKKTIALLALPKNYVIKKDGFVISSPNETEIQIKGKNAVNVGYGIYDVLEKNLRIKWLFPSEENIGTYIPHHKTITLMREERKEEPAFINRKFSGGSVSKNKSYQDWIKKMRMSSFDIKFHHNLYKLFPPSELRLTKPEYYPVTKGVRYPLKKYIGAGGNKENHTWQPVLTASGIVNEATIKINAYFNENPTANSFSLGMNDTTNWGDIQLQDKPQNSIGFLNLSDYFTTWANKVASNVLKTNSNKYFGFLAYQNIADAPTIEMHNALVPFLTYDAMFRLDNEKKLSNNRRIIDWGEKTTQIGIYDYIYGDQILRGKPIYPIPRIYLPTMQEYYQFAYENKVRHYYAEAYPAMEWTEGPKLYITSKLLWNPYLDIKKELDDWYKACVGTKAAPSLAKYYQFWEDFWMNRTVHSNWFKDDVGDYLNFRRTDYTELLTKEDIVYLDNLIENMLNNAASGEFKSRAVFFHKGWNSIKDRILGGVMVSNSTMPNGYRRIFIEDFEKNDVIPKDWKTWSRPDTEAIVHENRITTETAYNGKKSFKIALTPNGSLSSSTVIYKTFNNLTEKKYCIRFKTKSNASEIKILSTQYKNNNGNWIPPYNLYSLRSDNFYTAVKCFTIPENIENQSIRILLGVFDQHENKKFETFFDDVELFEYSPSYYFNTYGNTYTLYPNPTSEISTISLSEIHKKIEVVITSITGQLLAKTTHLYTNKLEISLKEFESGIYIVKICTPTEVLGTTKIIKK